MMAATKQSHRLTSMRGMLETRQSPQRDAIKDGQKDNARRVHSDAQSSDVRGQ